MAVIKIKCNCGKIIEASVGIVYIIIIYVGINHTIAKTVEMH